MSGSTNKLHEDEKYWTVTGTYCDEEFGATDAPEGDFAGVFAATTAEGAQLLAHEYEPWLLWDSGSVVLGADPGVEWLIPDSQLERFAPERLL
jgi:hypothetical protein